MVIDSNVDAVKGQIWAIGSIPQRSISRFFALWGRQSLRPVGLFLTMLSMQPSPTPPHSDIALGVASLDTWRPIVEMWLIAVIVGPKVPMRHESCRGVVPNARLPCSTCSCRLCHTFCDSLGCFDDVQLTCTLPYKVQYNNIDRIVPTGRWETQMHETRHAAAPQAAHTQTQVFPKRVHYNGIQMVQYIIPNATTNLPH